MEDIFRKIDEVLDILELEQVQDRQKKRLLAPALTETRLIPVILEQVNDLCNNSPAMYPDKYSMRDYFVLVVVLLYCPQVFTGKLMSRGLRNVISEVMGVSGSHISTYVRQVWGWCKYYPDLKDGIWRMYGEILSRLAIAEQ